MESNQQLFFEISFSHREFQILNYACKVAFAKATEQYEISRKNQGPSFILAEMDSIDNLHSLVTEVRATLAGLSSQSRINFSINLSVMKWLCDAWVPSYSDGLEVPSTLVGYNEFSEEEHRNVYLKIARIYTAHYWNIE